MPGQRLGTSGEPSSSVNPLAKVVFFLRNPFPQAAAGKTSGLAFYDLRISSCPTLFGSADKEFHLTAGPEGPTETSRKSMVTLQDGALGSAPATPNPCSSIQMDTQTGRQTATLASISSSSA